jgi:replicative DNA helicase
MTHLSKLEEYGNEFVVKVIHSLLKNRSFLLNIRDVLELEFFTHPGHHWIIDQTIKYFDKYHTSPTLEFFKIEVKKVDSEILKIAITEQLKSIYSIDSDDQEYVEQEFDNFCINQKLKKALLESVELLNQGDFEGIRFNIENAIKSGQDKNIGHEYQKDVEVRYRETSRSAIPTPWDVINTLLEGGLGSGDFGLLYGGPGGGKSWSLVALGAFAITLGYKVIHYTLELGEDYVGKRYDAYLTQIPMSLLRDNMEVVQSKMEELGNNLIIREYAPKNASLTTIESHIQKCADLGFDADLIIIDYVDLLKPPMRRKDAKAEVDDLYYGTKGLAKKLKKPIWSVSQVNRAGAKDDVVEGDKAAGSYDKMMVIDFGMSLSRLKKDKVNGTGRWHIMKNRYGADGMTYNVDIDIEMGNFTIRGEYDDTEPYSNPNNDYIKEKSKENYNKVEKGDKEILLERFRTFKIG